MRNQNRLRGLKDARPTARTAYDCMTDAVKHKTTINVSRSQSYIGRLPAAFPAADLANPCSSRMIEALRKLQRKDVYIDLGVRVIRYLRMDNRWVLWYYY